MQDSVPAALLQKWKTLTVYCRFFMRTEDTLLPALLGQISNSAADWLQSAQDLAATGSVQDLLGVYPQASRYLGRQPFVLSEPDSHTWNRLTHEDVGRLLLLLARYRAQPASEDVDAAATECFEQGDSREQQSWMRTVAWLPQPVRFLPLVIDTCRTNILPLFEAVACENVYPSQYFPDRNFNQVVLKAMFNGVALARIVGLDFRRNAELSRMASDYADERRAAGRSIPADISLALLDPPTTLGASDAQRTHA